MKMRNALAALALSATALASFQANATTVSPVMVDLQSTGRGVVSNISVTNTGAGPLPIEISETVLDPTPTGLQPAKDSSKAGDDLLVTPPSALIPPGQTQTFRVQWIGDPDLAQSKHYYVGIDQLPVKLPEGQSAVQIVYNFNVLVSVSGSDKKPQLEVKSAQPVTVDGKPAIAVTVENDGQAHGYISQHRIKLTETSASGAELFSKTLTGAEFQQAVGYGLVASGQTRTVNIPVDSGAPAGARATAVLMDERGQ